MSNHVSVAVIKDQNFLILQRGETAPWMPLKYCLPGGKVDPNETLEEAAKRELYEETGINNVVLYSSSVGKKMMFYCFVKDYTVKLNWEHINYFWINREEIKDYVLVPGVKSFIDSLVLDKILY